MTNRHNATRHLVLLVGLGSILSPSPALADFQYILKDLGTLGGTTSSATGVNNAGQVVGFFTLTGSTSTTQGAFISAPNGGALRNLGTLNGTVSSFATGVNASGQVVGSTSSTQSGFGLEPSFLSASNGGALSKLGTLPNGGFSSALGVNDSGQVTGQSEGVTPIGTQYYHAFLSAAGGGTLKDLGTLGGRTSQGNAVNAAGQVTGIADFTGDTTSHAFLSAANGGTLKDLGLLGTGLFSQGNAVNSAGQVAGTADLTLNGMRTAFLSAPNGGALADLGVLGLAAGNHFSEALGINASGQVVGDSTITSQFSVNTHAFLYRAGSMIDLNNLIDPSSGFILVQANAISDNGYIVGYGTTSGGQQHAYMLIPNAVPEPSAFALTALGIATLAAAWRRRV